LNRSEQVEPNAAQSDSSIPGWSMKFQGAPTGSHTWSHQPPPPSR
jgi:hypothetical protein